MGASTLISSGFSAAPILRSSTSPFGYVLPQPSVKWLTAPHQTIVQLLEAEDDQLTNNIRSSSILISSIRQLAASPPPSRSGARRSHDPNDPSASSEDDFEDDGLDQDGEGEIASLARRILDLTEEQSGRTGEDSHLGAAKGEDGAQVGSQNSDHAALRASVHRALSGQH